MTRVFAMKIAAAKPLAVTIQTTRNRRSVIVCASACAAFWRTIGSSAFVWKRARVRARPMSHLPTTPPGNGPFAKNSDGINVGQAYLGYKGFKDITLTAGRMPNPLVYTPMTWDIDINPEGLAEQWKHTFTFGGDGSASESGGYTKDGTALPKTQKKSEGSSSALKIDVFVHLAQFIYDDSNPENPLGARAVSGGQLVPNTDAFLLAWQVGAKFTFPNNLYAQIAPTLLQLHRQRRHV